MYIYVFLDYSYMPYAYCITDKYFDDGKLMMYRLLGNKKAVFEAECSPIQHGSVYREVLTEDYYFNEGTWSLDTDGIFLTKNDLKRLTRVEAKDIEGVKIISFLLELNTFNYIGCSSDYSKLFNYRIKLRDKGILTRLERIICKGNVKELYYSDLSIEHEKDDKIDLSTELDDNMIAKYLLLH